MKNISHERALVLFLIPVLLFCLYGGRLFYLQVIQGEYYTSLAEQRRTTIVSVAASRGELLDRKGLPLAANRAGLSLLLDSNHLPRERLNEILLSLTALLSAAEEPWNDQFPLSRDAPYTVDEQQTARVAALKQRLSLSDTATATDILAACVRRYGLSEYPPAAQRLLAGIRYTMETVGFGATLPYPFADDVSPRTAARVSEDPATYTGVVAQALPVREYPCGRVAAHLIGTIGPLYAEEYATLREQGYRLTDHIGKSGLEAALESTLRGTTGVRTLYWNNDGTLERTEETRPAVVGDSVILTLDSALQATAQQIIGEQIALLRAQPNSDERQGQDVQSGAAILLDVRDGGVLVCASYPDYDLSRYRETYTSLSTDPEQPLFNRALFGTFPCGSVIKPAVAVAGLTEGILQAEETLIHCDGRYHAYESVGFAPKCMGRHGDVTLTEALRRSCNVYFFEAGRLLGIDAMNRTLSAFGLGQKTGLEIGEATGLLASPATKNGTWVAGDTCQCAIGQMDQRFTPVQLAAYAMTLANGGTRYRTHLVHATRRYDGQVVSVYQPQILSTVSMDDTTSAAVKTGMQAVVAPGGTAYTAFKTAPYTLAAKTGTAQNSTLRSDHGIFIAYAPAEQPEVALAVVMENGTSAAATAVARRLLDAYFAD